MNFIFVLEITLGIILASIVMTAIGIVLYKPLVRYFTKKANELIEEQL